jgi:hypothetical protein
VPKTKRINNKMPLINNLRMPSFLKDSAKLG